MSNGDSYK